MEVSLFSNMLAGEIPPSFAKLSTLHRLQLDDNFFEGTIPRWQRRKKSMEGLPGNRWIRRTNDSLLAEALVPSCSRRTHPGSNQQPRRLLMRSEDDVLLWDQLLDLLVEGQTMQ